MVACRVGSEPRGVALGLGCVTPLAWRARRWLRYAGGDWGGDRGGGSFLISAGLSSETCTVGTRWPRGPASCREAPPGVCVWAETPAPSPVGTNLRLNQDVESGSREALTLCAAARVRAHGRGCLWVRTRAQVVVGAGCRFFFAVLWFCGWRGAVCAHRRGCRWALVKLSERGLTVALDVGVGTLGGSAALTPGRQSRGKPAERERWRRGDRADAERELGVAWSREVMPARAAAPAPRRDPLAPWAWGWGSRAACGAGRRGCRPATSVRSTRPASPCAPRRPRASRT